MEIERQADHQATYDCNHHFCSAVDLSLPLVGPPPRKTSQLSGQSEASNHGHGLNHLTLHSFRHTQVSIIKDVRRQAVHRQVQLGATVLTEASQRLC